jgi:predicted Fe-S protein YdhL (DUF1289 family)
LLERRERFRSLASPKAFGFATCRRPVNPPKMTIESPCIDVCRMAEDKSVCIGCHRTLAEIAAWSTLTDTEKLRILTAVREREAGRKIETPRSSIS